MNPATKRTMIAPTIRYTLLWPPDPLLRILALLLATTFLFLAGGKIVTHAPRLPEGHQTGPWGIEA
jgi:hypothetical protein